MNWETSVLFRLSEKTRSERVWIVIDASRDSN
jgi:hypothetical protein